MKKLRVLTSLLCLAALLLAGCTTPGVAPETTTSAPETTSSAQDQTSAGAPLPTADEDYWEVLCENFDFTHYLGASGFKFMTLRLISAKPLAGETLTFTTDLGGSAEVTLLEANRVDRIGKYVSQAYQGYDWATHTAPPVDEALAAAIEKIPPLRTYEFNVSFEALGVQITGATQTQYVHTITFTLGEESKTYSVGNLCFYDNNTELDYTYDSEYRLDSSTIFIGKYAATPSETGLISLPDWEVTAKENLTLEGIRFIDHPEITIVSCNVSLQNAQGEVFTVVWDGKSPLELDKDTIATLAITLEDPALANRLDATILRYVILDFTCGGETYGEWLGIDYHTSCNPHDIYAWKVDGVDVMPYYRARQAGDA